MSIPHIFLNALKDVMAPKVLWVSLFSFVATVLFFVGMIFLVFGGIESLSLWIATWLQNVEGNLESNWLLSFLSLIVVAKTVLMVLFFLSSAMAVYYLFLMVYSVIVGFFAGYFIKEIAQTYYPQVVFYGIALPSYLWFLIKILAVSIFLMLLFSPLVFIPLLNIVLLIPVYYLFHKLLVLEVASVMCSNEEYRQIQKKYSGQSRVLSGLCFALTLIPVVGVVIYPYYVIVMSHFLLGKVASLRGV